jgi:hypothetical protein
LFAILLYANSSSADAAFILWFFVISLLFFCCFLSLLSVFLLFVFCGLGCFRSSTAIPLRSLAVFPQQQSSLGGCCFSWLGLFEPFCLFKLPCAAPG